MKKNILKVFAVLLALAMLFSLASCGKDNKGSETDTSSASGTESGEKGGGFGTAKPGGKDPGKTPAENEKQTGENTSETSKPYGGKQEEKASAEEPANNDNTGEFVIPSEEVQLPIVEIR